MSFLESIIWWIAVISWHFLALGVSLVVPDKGSDPWKSSVISGLVLTCLICGAWFLF